MAIRKRVARRVPTRRQLGPRDILSVIAVIDKWPNDIRITWEGLVGAVASLADHRWTRQTLERHPEIKAAYQGCRDGSRTAKRSLPKDPAEVLLRKQIEALNIELKALKETLSAYEYRFACHEYNASLEGWASSLLSRPLPEIDRGRTDV